MADKRLGTVSVIGPDGQPADIDPAKDIAIDGGLSDEMAEQPGLFAYYAMCAERSQARVKQLNYRIHCLQEDLDAEIRRRVAKTKEKLPEAGISAEISRHVKMRALYEKKIKANAVKGQLYALREAFAQRASMLQSISANFRAEGIEVRTLREVSGKASRASKRLRDAD
jgi:hypothetical protein